MNKPIGGRGKRAPYETTHVRVPVDLKAKVEQLVEQYRNDNLEVSQDNNNILVKKLLIDYDGLVDSIIDKFKDNNLFVGENLNKICSPTLTLTCEEAIDLANKLLATRETKKQILNKLIAAIYQIEVKL